MSYISWMDLCAYLDWAALRPMTELEYEKVCRGTTSAVSGEYAWGSTSITAAATISVSQELGSETISTASANANYNNTTFTGGDAWLGSANQQGPLRGGIFATGSSGRTQSGAGYYGAMELTGNIEERVVTIGNSNNPSGYTLAFMGTHGDGILVAANMGLTYEGNANVSTWPHTDTSQSQWGVTKADGSGRKGYGWNYATAADMAVSARKLAAFGDNARSPYYGGRGVRTYDGPGP